MSDADTTTQDEPAAAPEAAAAPSEPAAAAAPAEPTDDDRLDLERGEVTDEDLDGLEAALDALDFATRRASPERLARLRGLIARAADVADQLEQGVRRPAAERTPLSDAQRARYQELVDGGVAAGERGDLPGARRLLEEAAALDPDGVDANFNLGVVYGLIAHREVSKAEFYDDYTRDEVLVEKAKLCYDRVLEAVPQHLPSLKNLATLYAMRDERDLAAGYLRRLIEVAPQDDEDRELIAEAKAQLAELESV